MDIKPFIKAFFKEVYRVENLKNLNKVKENIKQAMIILLSMINIYASSKTTPYDPKSYIHLYYCIIIKTKVNNK